MDLWHCPSYIPSIAACGSKSGDSRDGRPWQRASEHRGDTHNVAFETDRSFGLYLFGHEACREGPFGVRAMSYHDGCRNIKKVNLPSGGRHRTNTAKIVLRELDISTDGAGAEHGDFTATFLLTSTYLSALFLAPLISHTGIRYSHCDNGHQIHHLISSHRVSERRIVSFVPRCQKSDPHKAAQSFGGTAIIALAGLHNHSRFCAPLERGGCVGLFSCSCKRRHEKVACHRTTHEEAYDPVCRIGKHPPRWYMMLAIKSLCCGRAWAGLLSWRGHSPL